MSTLNLGFQCVGLMQKKMEPNYEHEAAKCNSLATLQNTAERVEGFDTAILDSISPVKCLLVKLLERLELKGKKFLSYTAASEIGELVKIGSHSPLVLCIVCMPPASTLDHVYDNLFNYLAEIANENSIINYNRRF